MSDTIRFICPKLSCRSVLSVPGKARGKVVRCSSCGTNVRVPGGATKPTRPAAPTPDAAGEAEKTVK